MNKENMLDELARVLVDAFDVDIQLYQRQILSRIASSPQCSQFVVWANSNPQAFTMLLRAVSSLLRRVPHDHNIALKLVTDQLKRLPVEIHRIFLEPSAVNTSCINAKNTNELATISGPTFRENYEEAIKDLSEEDLMTVASLPKNRLAEWIDNPVKMRPILLKKWKEEMSRPTVMETLKKNWSESMNNLERRTKEFEISSREFRDEAARRRKESEQNRRGRNR